ncbi:choline sulfate utilization transcriptional regulator [Microbaculum marinum]|uniref:LysR substrate-binding domain-containing protein n=1 Tax=Microbaculum marinum TaxID=1764581 RepID=A0AAW9RUG4_9HYPH
MTERKLDLGWLRTFEAVGRLGNLTRAAGELGLSQPSVSYQIRRLEEEIGAPLLRRLHRGIELTEEGRIFHEAAAAGVSRVDEAARRIRQQVRKPAVRLYTDYGFASLWLMPRVPEFRRLNPDIEVHIVASQALESDLEGVADIAVMFGEAGDFGADARLLMPERVVPICAPGFLQRFGPVREAADIAAAPLLHLDTEAKPRWVTWPSWLAEHGIARDPGQADLGLNTYELVIQAAIAEQGIALGWIGLVDAFLERGTLVPVAAELERPRWGYWLVPTTSRNPAMRALHDWLLLPDRNAPETETGGGMPGR